MKNRRRILFAFVLFLGVCCSLSWYGCKDKCGSTTCQNGGTCSSNVCICPIGYSGNACQNGWSTPVIGTYNCKNENCTPFVVSAGTWQSSITVDATNGGYTVDISNFDNSPVSVAATVDSSIDGISAITISSALGGGGINATGIYDSTTQTISLKYSTSSVGLSYTCNMVMVKIQ